MSGDTNWLKIAITWLSNTRFTCKIIDALYIWHIKAGKVNKLEIVSLVTATEAVLAPVSVRSSRRRRQPWNLITVANQFLS